MNTEELIIIAKANVKPVKLSRVELEAGTVGCAVLARNGKVYEGVCVHLACGIGFCAEASAIANMLRDGETVIKKIVASSADGILSPCGRCREMMVQVNKENLNTIVILSTSQEAKLSDLIPHHWMG